MIQRSSSKKKKWKPLREGDIVDIIAPASESTAKLLLKAQRFVERFGLTPRIPPRIFGDDPVCSNKDSKRWGHLKKALLAKDSKAIWCLRGGYGSQRLLPQLKKLKPPHEPKVLIGYSDITSLHLYLNYFWNWPSLHGSMLEELGRGLVSKKELSDFQNILYGTKKKLDFLSLQPFNKKAQTAKTIRAPLIGGNLTLLCSQVGTPWQVNFKGFILAIEEVGERGYSVDRMLFQMEKAGCFKGVRAVIFGEFVGGKETNNAYLWKDIQKRFAKDMTFPVLVNLPFGHGLRQRPLPLNTTAYLQLGKKPFLQISTGSI